MIIYNVKRLQMMAMKIMERPQMMAVTPPYPRATSRVSKCPPYTKQNSKTRFLCLVASRALLFIDICIHLGRKPIYVRSVVYKLEENYT